ncbi:hypothetical protein ABFS82_03G105100 [Erythranthe guttata]
MAGCGTVVLNVIVRSPDSFGIPNNDAAVAALEAAVRVQLIIPFDVDRATKEAIIEKANKYPVFIVSIEPEEKPDLGKPALKRRYAAINWLRMQLIVSVQLVWLGMLLATAFHWVRMKFAAAIGWFTAALGLCRAAICYMWMRSSAASDWMRIRCAAAFDCVAASFNWLSIQFFEALGWLGMPSWTIILMLVILSYYVRSLFEDTLSSLNTLRRMIGLLIFVCILRAVVIKAIEIDDAISKWRKGDR